MAAMRRFGPPFVVFALVAYLCLPPAVAFEAKRYPFLPFLTLEREPSICAAFLGAIRESFLSNDPDITASDKDWPGQKVRWLFPLEQYWYTNENFRERLRANITLVPADLDQDGQPEALALVSVELGWRGYNFLALRYPSVAIAEYLVDTAVDLAAFVDAGEPVGPYNERSVGWSKTRYASWDLPKIGEIDGVYYVVEGRESYPDEFPRALLRVSSTGSSKKVCEAPIAPDPNSTTREPWGSLDVRLGTLTNTIVRDYVATLQNHAGHESFCGTLNAQSRHLLDVNRAQLRLALRPWALLPSSEDRFKWTPSSPSPSGDDVPEDVSLHLEYWTYQTIWNFRQARYLRALGARAREDYAQYLASAFGLTTDAAGREAYRALQVLRANYFVLSRSFDAVHYMKATSDRRALLRRSILTGAPVDVVQGLIDASAWPVMKLESVPSGAAEPEDPFLALAVEHVALMPMLLRAGAPVDDTNPFGKTALMYAAQFGEIAAARFLLDSGASVQARTRTLDNCWYRVQIGERTALMYAAENAGPEMIELLLARGADPRARDTAGRDVRAYLSLNRSLSPEDRMKAEALLDRDLR